MQKNYRDYTVGELLDLDFNIEVSRYAIPTKKQAEEYLSHFEGIKRSSHPSSRGTLVVNGWKGKFKVTNYVY